MEFLSYVELGMTIGLVMIVISKSIYIPKPMQISAIMLFGKLYDFMENVEGKYLSKEESEPNDPIQKWDLVDDYLNEKSKKWNIHFYLWPFCRKYSYELTYTKIIQGEGEKAGDIVLRKKIDPQTNQVIETLVARTRKTDFLLFRQNYPLLTTSISTEELANINTITNPILEITNPSKVLFSINNWLVTANSTLNAAIRGFVANINIYFLNKRSSEGGSETFNTEIKKVTDERNGEHPGLPEIGLKLFKISFEDFDPADDMAIKLMSSYTDVVIKKQEAEANIAKADGDAKVKTTLADAEAKAHRETQTAIIDMEKKKRVDTGTAKVDTKGNIVKLVPEANVKVMADAYGKLSNLKGTLVIGGDNPIANMLNLKKEDKE